MDSVLKFLKHWDNNLDDIVWEEKKRLIVKYNKFLTYDPVVQRKKLKDIINES